jgi:hypothetical protein
VSVGVLVGVLVGVRVGVFVGVLVGATHPEGVHTWSAGQQPAIASPNMSVNLQQVVPAAQHNTVPTEPLEQQVVPEWLRRRCNRSAQ